MEALMKGDVVVLPFPFSDFSKGSLNVLSMARPNKLFTADKSIILYKIGKLNTSKISHITDSIVNIFKN